MKTIIKINNNKKKLSDREIASRKPDFNTILKSFHAAPKPWYHRLGKWWLSWGAGAAVIVAVLLVLIFDEPQNNPEKPTEIQKKEVTDTSLHSADTIPQTQVQPIATPKKSESKDLK